MPKCTTVGVVRFLQKFDMQRELVATRYQVIESLDSERRLHAFYPFVIASWLQDWDLCRKAICAGENTKWGASRILEVDERLRYVKGGYCADPRTWCEGRADILPPGVLWARLRASLSIDWAYEKKGQDLEPMADEFVRLMKLKA
jgi:hypothetical protein